MEPELPANGESLELKRRNAQLLLAKGLISREEYDALGRLHGFVASEPSSTGSKALVVGAVLGYGFIILGAVVEIVSIYKPELRGPLTDMLDGLGKLLPFFGGG
jgi:hypothetical protein